MKYNYINEDYTCLYFQYVIKAPKSGIVEEILHGKGDNVPKDAMLVKVAADEE